MRPLVTWLVVGALAAIGLFAVRDAVTRTTAAETQTATSPAPAQAAPVRPPAIAGRDRLVPRLEAIQAEGALYLTDARCRRFVLSLPALRWAPAGRQPTTDCGFWSRPSAAELGIAARQVNADTIVVTSGGWSYAFEGTSPAFQPDGTLTFVRRGRLFEWTARCPPDAQIVRFEEVHEVPRCVQPIAGAPRNLKEVSWLGDRRYAAIAGPDGAASVLVVDGRGQQRLFTGVGTRVGALESSPAGGYLAARLDGTLALFRAGSPGVRPLPTTDELVLGISWSPDDRLAAIATESRVQVFRVDRPQTAVVLPLSAAAIRWR
ncbi:MAG TPA: hypothetical protein VFW80_02115 [Gaiellaceae bacterium]|nr:hypothetical protein [Gaiellaceae bacterium]